MIRYLIAYASTAVVFIALDAAWLSTMSKLLYQPLMGDLLADRVSPAPAIGFYAIYVAGIVLFAVVPGLDGRRWTQALGYGAALGLVAYAAYDLTNMATLKGWPAAVTWADLAWGTLATAVAASVGCVVTGKLT